MKAQRGTSLDPGNVKARERTRLRQLRSFRQRRLDVFPKDDRTLKAVARGFGRLDWLEHRNLGMTRFEVAASLGLSHEAVRLIEARAIAKIRKALGIE